MTRRHPLPKAAALGVAVLAASLATAASAGAQSVLDRTPNLSTGWVGQPSTLHLNVLHRFDVAGPPTRKVNNTPTLLLGWGVGGYALLGVHYASSSSLVPEHPNEFELLGRFSPLSTSVGAPVGVGLTAAWNDAAGSFDGELSLTIPRGALEVVTALRGFADAWGGDDGRWAFGLGAVLDVSDHVALTGDFVRPFTLEDGEAFGWGAAVQVAIPATPHSLSLQATNTNSATLQGSSRRSNGTRYGFEFTIPVDPRRFFGGRPGTGEDPGARAGEVDLVAGDTVDIAIRDLEYGTASVAVRPGTYVRWTNEGEGVHSVTSDSWESPLLAPGETFGRIFTEVGEHAYHCVAHPSVRATLTVRAAGGR